MGDKSSKYSKNYPQSVYHRFFVGLFLFLVASIAATVLYVITTGGSNVEVHLPIELTGLDRLSVVRLESPLPAPPPRNPNCTYWDCFNVYRCGVRGHNRITVYIYPLREYLNDKDQPVTALSREFYQILKTIRKSRYYTWDPNSACILVPSIDTLNQNRLDRKFVARALHSLPSWNDGENHLLFNMLPGSAPDYKTVLDIPTGNAMIAGAGFDSWTFRTGFDVSLPVFSPEAATIDSSQPFSKSHLIISAQINLFIDDVTDLKSIASSSDELLLLEDCSSDHLKTNHSLRCQYKTERRFDYPQILKHGVFCLILRSVRLGQSTLMDALASSCIPIIVADSVIMPFEPFIDWHRVALFIPEENLTNLLKIVNSVSKERTAEMYHQTRWLYDKYFSTMEKITMTTLDIINEKAFPLTAKQYEDWNLPDHLYGPQNPLFLPVTAAKSPGFTAVILTYDRVESLFTLIRKLVRTPSLAKVLVVWNNQKKPPPPSSEWPVISKPLKVIQTQENKLSNRFYPYSEITTECQLTIDDDIVMLTPDELEFGFDVWREFPDRIVGFPSRLHMWDNATSTWKYHSEWTNEISMVLTGAAFHHKIWSWYYTTRLPRQVRDFVDDQFNCEDIAMNFLVANITNKAPIKVAPRKKFKCPECTNNEMLSADLGHMTQRSECVHRFAEIFGRMALKSVEFRADPVLYKDNLPSKLKKYNDVGAL